MQAWFLSDIHIKELNERNSQILLRFLFSVRSGQRPATHIFFLGDIFDFWVGDQAYYEKKFQPFVQELDLIVKMGIQVFYMEGNHDVHVRKFWQRMGVDAFVDDRYLTIQGQTFRLTHGDLMNPEDTTYLKYREFIRRWYMEIVADYIPAKPFEVIGKWASLNSRSKSYKQRQLDEVDLRKKIRNYATQSFQEKAFDWMISGHMHVRDDWTSEVQGKKFRSINLGSWFTESKVLCITDQGAEWIDVNL